MTSCLPPWGFLVVGPPSPQVGGADDEVPADPQGRQVAGSDRAPHRLLVNALGVGSVEDAK
jgi:hypothetical protein